MPHGNRPQTAGRMAFEIITLIETNLSGRLSRRAWDLSCAVSVRERAVARLFTRARERT